MHLYDVNQNCYDKSNMKFDLKVKKKVFSLNKGKRLFAEVLL